MQWWLKQEAPTSISRSSSLTVLLLGLCPVIGAAATPVTVTAGTGFANPGGTVDIPITLSGNTGFSSLGIEILFDSTALKLTNVASTGTGATFTAAPDYDTLPYNMSWDSAANSPYNGTIATMTFQVTTAARGTYPIMIDYYKGRDGNYTDGEDVNYDEAWNPLDMRYQSGSVQIADLVSTAAVNVNVNGQNKTETLTAKQPSAGNIIAVLYDKNGVMLARQTATASANVNFNMGLYENCSCIKLMWWNVRSLAPLSDSKKIDL